MDSPLRLTLFNGSCYKLIDSSIQQKYLSLSKRLSCNGEKIELKKDKRMGYVSQSSIHIRLASFIRIYTKMCEFYMHLVNDHQYIPNFQITQRMFILQTVIKNYKIYLFAKFHPETSLHHVLELFEFSRNHKD